MVEIITKDLIYEILKQLQCGVAEMKATLADHTRQFIRVREEINAVRDDISDLRSDDLRGERMQADMWSPGWSV
jgi:hypothetical protein